MEQYYEFYFVFFIYMGFCENHNKDNKTTFCFAVRNNNREYANAINLHIYIFVIQISGINFYRLPNT